MKILPWTVILMSSTAFASSEKGGDHMLSASAGIVEPSFATSVFQNPAGIAFIPSFQLGVQAGWSDSFNNPVYRGDVLYGDQSFGATAGVSDHPQRGSGETSAFGGISLNIPGIKSEIGGAAFTGLSPSGGTSVNVGWIFVPNDKIHLGATVFGVGDVNEYGGGLEVNLDTSFSLVVDATADKQLKTFNAQPGLLIKGGSAALSLSYGTSPGSQQIDQGFSAGASVFLGNTVTWEAYYNHLAKFYTALSIKL
jgi:hypothetical protein